jgi:hypothetical protein
LAGPLHVIAALVVAVAALLSLRPGFATDYASNPNPACRLMRNNTVGAPFPPEPNHADTQAAQTLINIHTYRPALPKLLKIDREGTDALKQLPPDLPRIDLVIDRHLINLQWARGALGDLLRNGALGPADKEAAVAIYRRAVDTSFTDDRGCVHGFTASFDTRLYLAAMYLYGNGTAPDRATARKLMQGDDSANASAIVAAIDGNQLPGQYVEFLRLARTELKEPGPTLHDLQNKQREKIIAKMFDLPNEEPSASWTGYLIAALVAALVGIVAFVIVFELRRARNVPHVGLFAAFGRLDLFFKGVMSFGVGCVTLYAIFSTPALVSSQPWYLQWLGYAMIAAMLIAVGQGVFRIAAALRVSLAADPPPTREAWKGGFEDMNKASRKMGKDR